MDACHSHPGPSAHLGGHGSRYRDSGTKVNSAEQEEESDTLHGTSRKREESSCAGNLPQIQPTLMLPTKIFFSIPPGKHIIQLYSSKFSVPWHQKSLKKSEILPNHCPDFLRISAFLQRENKTSYIRSVFIEDHGRRYSLCFPYYKPILSYLTEYNLHHFPFCPK